MIILITGCSKGIGLEITKQLAQEHQIIAVSRSEISFSHSNLVKIQGDITNKKILNQCIKYLDTHQLNLDILINNAGILIYKKFEEITEADLLKTYSTNVFAPFLWIQALLDYLRPSPYAHILNITSMGGITGTQKFSGLSAYSSSKAALSVLTECLAEELKSDKISCNGLALGAVQTEMLAKAFPEFKAPLLPSQMAEFISWFALNGQKFFNGKILPVATSTP